MLIICHIRDHGFIIFILSIFCSVLVGPLNIIGMQAVTLNTTAINLSWNQPQQYKNEYTYWIRTTGCGSQNTTVTQETAVISGLTSGTNCTFCVSVRAMDNTEGELVCISQYTSKTVVMSAFFFTFSTLFNSFNFIPTAHEQSRRQCSPVSPARDPITPSWCHGSNLLGMWSILKLI